MNPAIAKGARRVATPWAGLLALALAACACAARAADPPNAGSFGAGIELRPQATHDDLGLPPYPGATRRHDAKDDTTALTFALWGGSHGFKLVVLKYASDAPIDRVARFYRDALGRYGEVLDCSPPQPAPTADTGNKVLRCDEAKPEPGTRLFKAGTPNHFHLASMKPAGDQVHFDLVRIDIGPP